MMTKIFVFIGALVAVCSAGVVPVPAALTVGTYASSYNAHAINHAIAAPYVAAPLAYSAYSALPAAYSAHPAAYSALPAAYSALPAYSAPIIAGRR